MPQCYEDDGTDQCPEKGNTKEIDVADASDDDDIGHQPDADERGNDGSNETKWQSPPYDKFCQKADDSGNY